MYGKLKEYLQTELQSIEDNGLFKRERIITSPQGAEIEVNGKRRRENDIKFELWFLIGARFCHRELTGSALKQRFRLIQRQACALGVDDEDTLSNLRSISTDDSSFSAQFKEWQV